MSSQLCRFLLEEKQKLFCACIKSKSINERKDDYLISQIPCIRFTKPTENNNNESEYEKTVKEISEKITKYIKENEIDTIWCPLQGETLLKVYSYIQNHTKNKYYITQIWDPFEWMIIDLGYNKEKQKKLLALFDKVVEKSSSILTASEPMAKIYTDKYNIKSIPIYTSYELPEKKETPQKNGNHIICISGQTYASRGIKSLLQALELMNWQHDGKQIIIEYYGTKPEPFEGYEKHVKLKGYVKQSELIEAEKNASLLYCSYYFDNSMLDVVRKQSYPSKIVTYIPSSVPIIIHSEDDSPIYQDFKRFKCGYLISSTDIEIVKQNLQRILSAPKKEKETIVNNSFKLFKTKFTHKQNKKNFLKAFGLTYSEHSYYKVLELNNVDTFGHIWNGYDIMRYINDKTDNLAIQIVIDKFSKDNQVVELFSNQYYRELDYYFTQFENNQLSTLSCLSVASPALEKNTIYKNSDIVHYHLIHNMKLSLFDLMKQCTEKPSVISIHDPWIFTGHCVHFGNCHNWEKGCKNCPHLDYLFPLKKDNSSELWKIKQLVFNNIDADFVVSTRFMYDLFKTSPITKGKRVHLIPFGIDINKFNCVSKNDARKKYNIPTDSIVLFHRAQKEFKGTNYFVKALELLHTKKDITIITCGEKNHFKKIEGKYRVIELGVINDEELSFAYNACDMLIMPSVGESFGMMAVEAMSCNKPVICFNNTALPSVIHAPRCGIAVENLNSEKLMEAIKFLIENDDERISRGKLGRKIVEKEYSSETYLKRIDELYKKIYKRKIISTDKIKSMTETDEVIKTKKQLNKLTKIILPSFCDQYKNLYFTTGKRVKDRNNIAYSDKNVQLLISDYNKKALNQYLDFKENNPVDPRIHAKIIKYSKIITTLLLHDRRKMIYLIRKRIKKVQ